MNKRLLVLSVVLFVAWVLFVSGASARPVETKTLTGVVDSVLTGADVMSGNMSEIVVVDESGKKMAFAIKTGMGVTLSGASRVGSIRDLKKGIKVNIEYMTTSEGLKKVMTIDVPNYREEKPTH